MKTTPSQSGLPSPPSRDKSPGGAFPEFIDALDARARVCLSWTLAVLLVILVVVVTVTGVRASSRARIAHGFEELAKADTVEKLEALTEEYEGSPAGARASFMLAKRLYEDGRFAQAATRFSLLLQEYAESSLREEARLGEAYALEAAGKLIQAEKEFEKLAGKAVDSALRTDAMLGAGRCARSQGKLAEAEGWYQRVLESTDDEQLKDRVSTTIGELSVARLEPDPGPPESVPDEPAEPEDAAAPDVPVED